MKVKNKIILILLLFVGIILLNHSNCYGFYDYTQEDVAKVEERIQALSKHYGNTYPHYIIYQKIDNPRLYFEMYDFKPTGIATSNNTYFYEIGNTLSYSYFHGTYNLNSKIFYMPYMNNSDDLTLSQPDVYQLRKNFRVGHYSYYSGSDGSRYVETQIVKSTFNFYLNDNVEFGDFDNSQATDNLVYEGSDTKNEFQKMFELNLTDKDDNNKQHRFNIGTYSKSENYDELNSYLGRPYVIYLTDYERILTYDKEENMNFQYGSYLLSGYVDFLTTDQSYFYFSEYYNKVLSDSGNWFFNKDEKDYKKRFYFRLTYSEDSNDPTAEIWSDNGILQSASDKYYDPTYEADYSHFVGSSHSIFYVEEKNGKKKKFRNDLYYKGFYTFSLNSGGKTSDLMDENLSTIRYDFYFSGGKTQILYLYDNAYNYNEQIKNVYDILKRNYEQYIFSTDASAGDWHIRGKDERTSTYKPGQVTNDTSPEDDKKHEGQIRDPSKGNIQNKDDEKTEDTTNWGILDFLRNIYDTLTGGGGDTSSATNGITGAVGSVQDKFAFKDNLVNNANEIKDYIVNTQATHKYYLNINHKYLSGRVCIIDLSWYEPYKPTVDAFICAFAYLAFAWHMFCNIPSLISGASAGSYLNEISTYQTTSQLHSMPTIGRSASIHNRKFLD